MQKKTSEQQQARELRTQGIPLREIAQRLEVSKGSVSAWVREVELTQAQQAKLRNMNPAYNPKLRGRGGRIAQREKHLKLRKAAQDEGRAKAREQDFAHMQGCMLYWAEGAKDRNSVRFTNSDPYMMHLFLAFLRNYFTLESSRISVTLSCYTDNEKTLEEIEQYWLTLLKLEPHSLRKRKQDSRQRGILMPRKISLPTECVICSLTALT